MVLLYYIFKNPLNDQVASVCSDVEMSIEVFTAMGHHRVAKRCLELVSEVYELAKKTVIEQQEGLSMQSTLPMGDDSDFFANLIDPFLLEDYAFNDSRLNGLTSGPWYASDPNLGVDCGNALELFLNFTANR
jgi:hypothetical protein